VRKGFTQREEPGGYDLGQPVRHFLCPGRYDTLPTKDAVWTVFFSIDLASDILDRVEEHLHADIICNPTDTGGDSRDR